MDMSYATIPILGEHGRLYRETRLAYVISIPEYHETHPIYSVETYLGYAIFCNNAYDEQFDCEIVLEKEKDPKQS